MLTEIGGRHWAGNVIIPSVKATVADLESRLNLASETAIPPLATETRKHANNVKVFLQRGIPGSLNQHDPQTLDIISATVQYGLDDRKYEQRVRTYKQLLSQYIENPAVIHGEREKIAYRNLCRVLTRLQGNIEAS